MATPLFGIVPTGLPLITAATSTPTPTSFLYSIPTTQSFSHVVVFMLPGVILPENTAAAIYLVTLAGTVAGQPLVPNATPTTTTTTSKFIGGIGAGKESAIFKLSSSSSAGSEGTVVLGIAIEDEASVARQLEILKNSSSSSSISNGSIENSMSSLVRSTGPGQSPTTLVLAQRIIKNAFNFLASFSGTAGQVEVVPLKAFEGWWQKFERKIQSDPGFLERDE